MANDNFFDKTYLEYWNNIQKDSSSSEVRKIEVPSDEIVSAYIAFLKIRRQDVILDLGCSYGRLYPALSVYSRNIHGVDVDLDAINEAKKCKYVSLVKGKAEETNFASDFFDTIVCWAVYDCVNQNEALIEANRILKVGGKLLITGKNTNYRIDDNSAFIAERNAKLKSFPNHFTDVYKLINNMNLFGFKLIYAFGFEERGDLARNISFKIDSKYTMEFYEYVLIMEKVGDISEEALQFSFFEQISDVSKSLCKKYDYKNMMNFFNFHKIKFGE